MVYYLLDFIFVGFVALLHSPKLLLKSLNVELLLRTDPTRQEGQVVGQVVTSSGLLYPTLSLEIKVKKKKHSPLLSLLDEFAGLHGRLYTTYLQQQIYMKGNQLKSTSSHVLNNIRSARSNKLSDMCIFLQNKFKYLLKMDYI